jgi:mxaJ protein
MNRKPLAIVGVALAVAALFAGRTAMTGNQRPVAVLRVCADPNNLPFSNQEEEGFENRIASLVARAMGARVQYTWWAQRRGFVRNTLNAHQCDVVIGMPAHVDMVLTTRPYYRSTYVFVSRRDRGMQVHSFDDPSLRRLTVGVQLIGDDFANTPPAHALSRRGIVSNVRGFSVYGDYREPNPPARIIDAVASGAVDVAIVWGPLGGYFAGREAVPLDVTPVDVSRDSGLPLAYDIAMAVRKGDRERKEALDRITAAHQQAIDRILDTYAVPRVPRPAAPPKERD